MRPAPATPGRRRWQGAPTTVSWCLRRQDRPGHAVNAGTGAACRCSRSPWGEAADLVREYPDGVQRVELASVTGPELVAGEVADSIGVVLRGGSPEPPVVDGEHGWLLPSLAVPRSEADRALTEGMIAHSAVELFCDCGRGVDPAFELTTENADAVASICTQLDGLAPGGRVDGALVADPNLRKARRPAGVLLADLQRRTAGHQPASSHADSHAGLELRAARRPRTDHAAPSGRLRRRLHRRQRRSCPSRQQGAPRRRARGTTSYVFAGDR